jgi:hypothetical protein
MRRSTVLSLPFQLVFPAFTLTYYNFTHKAWSYQGTLTEGEGSVQLTSLYRLF